MSAAVAGVRQLVTNDAYGKALGFNMSAATSVLLDSGEQFDQHVSDDTRRCGGLRVGDRTRLPIRPLSPSPAAAREWFEAEKKSR